MTDNDRYVFLKHRTGVEFGDDRFIIDWSDRAKWLQNHRLDWEGVFDSEIESYYHHTLADVAPDSATLAAESAARQLQRNRRALWQGCVKATLDGSAQYLDAVFCADQILAAYDERVKDGRL